MQMSLDTWQSVHVSFDETENPSRQQVGQAVDQLDGKVHTEVSLKREEPFEYLTIGGGPDLFLVSGEARDGSFVQLRNPGSSDGNIKLVCGGQVSEYGLQDVVTRDQVQMAVEQFFDGLTGNLSAPWSVE